MKEETPAPGTVITLPWPDGPTWRRWAFQTILIVVVLYLAYVVREIWVPLGIAFLIATVLDPVVDRMEARGWKRGTATASIFGSFILIMAGLIVLATPHLVSQAEDLATRARHYFPDTSHKGLLQSFHNMHVPDWLANVGVRIYDGADQGFQRSSTWVTEYGMSFISNMVWVVIIPIVAFYALRDYHLILTKGLLLVPKRRREDAQVYIVEVGTIFAKYLRGLAIVSALNGLATWLLLMACQVPNALVLGLVAGVLYSVPYIGAMLTIVLTAAVAFLGGGTNMLILAVGLSFLLHQIIFDQIISPRILGGHVGLHPILAIVALLAGNLMLGIVGMILAVPVAACIQISVLAAVPKLRVDIDIAPPTSDASPSLAAMEQAAQTGQPIPSDPSEEVRQNVMAAVDQVEAQVKADQKAILAQTPAPEQSSGGE